jgi:energy-coupling factor transport system ATP-binding protein
MEKVLPAVEIRGLFFSYPSSDSPQNPPAVLEDLSLSIADNEFVAILGRNGGGKTTLLKNITGLLRPQRGEIFIRGKDTRAISVPDIAAELGFVMQNPDRQLFADTVYDEAAYALRNAGLSEGDIRPRVEAALEAVDLAGKKDAFPLALGRSERAKAVIAAVLAMGSRILILDEPAAGQDYRNSRLIMDLISRLHQEGYTIILVTHNMSLVAEYARRVIVLSGKRVSMDGGVADIFSRAGELAEAGILPPPITQLCAALRDDLPLKGTALCAGDLGDILLSLYNPNGS